MHFWQAAPMVLAASLIAAPAWAGEEPLYEATPDWVEVADLAEAEKKTDTFMLLVDKQAMLEDGRLWQYLDFAAEITSPEMLTQFGTISANWLPDKGDFIVHTLQLVRDGETIDLIADGVEFEVIRRERGLERRIVDGQLTATVNLPGVRVGDTLRVAYSITLSDQALGKKIQLTEGLPAGKFEVGQAGVSVSWPEDETFNWKVFGDVDHEQPKLEDGYYTLAIDIPVKEQEDQPGDAPYRYRLPPLLQVTNFDGYPDLSRVMYPHFEKASNVSPDSEIAAQAAKIMAEHETPLARAAAATRLVQDEISYLMNGLDGGNYLPQMPDETWEQRYGDCKAKSVLLLSILRQMDITSDVVLVQSQRGDAGPVLLPLAGNFDHMIVRAQIDGVTYWLDGTSAGTRLENITDVPRFYYALPLSEEGSDLVNMEERPKALPDEKIELAVDQTAGLFVPALFNVRIETQGAAAGNWQTMLSADKKTREQMLDYTVYGAVGDSSVTSSNVTYDEATSTAVITASGILWSPWNRKRGYSEASVPGQVLSRVSVPRGRTRPEWRDIPLTVNGPTYNYSSTTIALPDDGKNITLRGEEAISATVAGAMAQSTADLGNGALTLLQTYRTIAREIPADQVRAQRIAANRLNRDLPRLRTSGDVREKWQYFGKDKARLAAIEEAFQKYIDRAIERDEDIESAYTTRAEFRKSVYDYAGAIADYTKAYEEESSNSFITSRASARYNMGDFEAALADYRQAEELQGDGGTLYTQSEILSFLGRNEEAIAAAEEYSAFSSEAQAAEAMSYALSYAGRRAEAKQLLEETLLLEPDETFLLNTSCWQAGIFDEVTSETLDVCTEAVQTARKPAAQLDSRALAYFRLGNLERALEDVNDALELQPEMVSARYLRGVIRLTMGDKGGRSDVQASLAMRPAAKLEYGRWGIVPKR